jgi:1-acyl-sn-glycerol-3-phosphate acyltransferase
MNYWASDNRANPFTNYLEKLCIYVAQIAIATLLFIFRFLIVRNHLQRDKASFSINKLPKGTAFVVYANHQSFLDPAIITASMPFRIIPRLLPFRFFVENSYLRGFMKFFIKVLGGFPAHYDEHNKYGLDKAKLVLENKQTVFMFPSGTRTREHISKAGIAILAKEPNIYLIPVYIDWVDRLSCHVYIGRPIKGGISKSPEQLMDYLYKLPDSI